MMNGFGFASLRDRLLKLGASSAQLPELEAKVRAALSSGVLSHAKDAPSRAITVIAESYASGLAGSSRRLHGPLSSGCTRAATSERTASSMASATGPGQAGRDGLPLMLRIRPLKQGDIATVTDWARREGFAPGSGDLAIYRHTDRQGIWVGWLGQERIGCISGVRYTADYGFIGLYLVRPQWRGRGHGVALWTQAMEHLTDLPCIGLEAAPALQQAYGRWGFVASSPTTRR